MLNPVGRHMKLVLLILLLFITVSAHGDPVHLPQLDAAITKVMREKKIPGIAVALVLGKQSYLFSYGIANEKTGIPISQNTLFAIASITKVFTSTELALLVLRKKLSLANSIASFLPGLGSSLIPANRISLQQLATHTSSLPRSLPANYAQNGLTYPKLIEFLRSWRPDFPLGTHYLYSNIGFGLLGLAEENVSHQSYQQLIQRDILFPLGMKNTTVDTSRGLQSSYAQGYSPDGKAVPLPDRAFLPASGALWSSSSDMLQFLKANLGMEGPKELLYAMQTAQAPYFKVSEKLTLGLGWQRVQLKGYLLIDKNGGVPGFSSYIGMAPMQQVGIVILVNKAKMNATQVGRQLLLGILDMYTNSIK